MVSEFERPKTYVEWQLGNSCNYKCSYCHEMFRLGDKAFPTPEKILEVTKDIIFHYDELGRDVVFEFIGGEPTLLDKLPNISQSLHNHPVNISIRTNGSASIDWWRKMRKYVSRVVISVHREFCDVDHIMDLVNFLKNDPNGHEIKIKVLVPVTHKEDHFSWGKDVVKRLQHNFGVGEIQFLYSNFGRGSSQYLPYTPQQWKQADEISRGQIDQEKLESIPVSQQTFKKAMIKQDYNFHGYTCFSGIETIVINHEGDAWRGWCRQGGKIGNIFNDQISWPVDPIICGLQNCSNGFDRRSRKEPPSAPVR